MPFLSTKKHSIKFVPSSNQALGIKAISNLIDAIRSCKVPLPSKKRMLVHALWEVARVSGNFYPRYRSKDVTARTGLKIQRDHIYQKKHIVERLLKDPNYKSSTAVEKAQCCIVTKAEHEKLHRIDPNVDGFDRYRVAKIEICDMLQR